MRPAARLSAAIEILEDVLDRHRPATATLADWGKAHRFAGSGDRAAIGNLVYDALRLRLSLAARMGADTPRAIALAAAMPAWGLTVPEAGALCDGSEHAPGALTADEAAGLARDLPPATPPHVAADVPEWLWLSFVQAFGERAVAEGRAFAGRAPADLRVNTLKATREKVMKALAAHGPAATPLSPQGIRIAPPQGAGRTPNIQAEPEFQKGWFEMQDEASQVAALIAAAAAGPASQVLDLCAGGGGKTLAIAAELANRGQIFATDIDKARLAPIHDRLKRAGVRNVQVRPARPGSLDDLQGRMDCVVVDAPCTGTGVWRRRPEAKWRLSPDALARRIEEQGQILEGSVKFLKPGGRLVYITCSVLPEENEGQIDRLAGGSAGLMPVPIASLCEKAIGRVPEGAIHSDGRYLRLSPARHGTDGFFVAVLQAPR